MSRQKEYKNPTGGKYMIFFHPVYFLWETWEIMQALGDIILYFSPKPKYSKLSCQKEYNNPNGGNI
jgi:hypothetical protein